MSVTVTYVGKMKKFELFDRSLLDTVKVLAVKAGASLGAFGDADVYDIVDEYLDGEFEVISGDLYEIIKVRRFESHEDICIGSKNADGTIDFVTQFYNGGCCLNEALEECVEGI